MADAVHMVRHGEVWNPAGIVYAELEGYGLSRRGRSQAEAAAEHLRGRPLQAVISSPLLRALQTARPIAAGARLAVVADADLGEWRGAARWAGRRWRDLPQLFGDELDRYLNDPESIDGGETLAAVADRVQAAVERLHLRYPEGEVVCVSHQDPIQAGILRLGGGSLQTLNVDKPQHAEVLTLIPGRQWSMTTRWKPAIQHAFPPEEGGQTDRPGS